MIFRKKQKEKKRNLRTVHHNLENISSHKTQTHSIMKRNEKRKKNKNTRNEQKHIQSKTPNPKQHNTKPNKHTYGVTTFFRFQMLY